MDATRSHWMTQKFFVPLQRHLGRNSLPFSFPILALGPRLGREFINFETCIGSATWAQKSPSCTSVLGNKPRPPFGLSGIGYLCLRGRLGGRFILGLGRGNVLLVRHREKQIMAETMPPVAPPTSPVVIHFR